MMSDCEFCENPIEVGDYVAAKSLAVRVTPTISTEGTAPAAHLRCYVEIALKGGKLDPARLKGGKLDPARN